MSQPAARFTQAEIARAIRAAKACGMTVRISPGGTIEIVEKDADPTPQPPLEARREFSL